MIFHFPDVCPACHGDIRFSSVELHPTHCGFAVRMVHCPKCGEIPTKVLPLSRDAAESRLAPLPAR